MHISKTTALHGNGQEITQVETIKAKKVSTNESQQIHLDIAYCVVKPHYMAFIQGTIKHKPLIQ